MWNTVFWVSFFFFYCEFLTIICRRVGGGRLGCLRSRYVWESGTSFWSVACLAWKPDQSTAVAYLFRRPVRCRFTSCPPPHTHTHSHNITDGTMSVRKVLAGTTPGDCWVFSVGSVAFVVAPRGSGTGYRTHKRLGAELKGAHILRCAVERRVLSGSSGGGSSGRSRVNALAPLSCVVDVHGCRAAAIALPGIRPSARKSSRAKHGHLGAAVPWAFSEIRDVGLGGRTKTSQYTDVRSLITDHLALAAGDEPVLSIVEGVLSGGSTSKDLKREKEAQAKGRGADLDKSPPAAVILFPDLLPPESVPEPSAPALASGGAAAAIWGSVEGVRAILVPQDALTPVRTVVCLDLSVAEASIAAAAALAADEVGLDRYPPIRPEDYEEPGSSSSPHNNGSNGNGLGNGNGNDSGRDRGDGGAGGDSEDDNRIFAAGARGHDFGFGSPYKSGFDSCMRATTEDEKNRRAMLLAEATANALGCDRDSVVTTRLPARGIDLCSVRRPGSGGIPFDKSASNHGTESSGAAARAESLRRSPGSGHSGSVHPTVNQRASALAGKKIVGDVLVLLEAGGLRHGAARVESHVSEGDAGGALIFARG